jgi:cytochrome c
MRAQGIGAGILLSLALMVAHPVQVTASDPARGRALSQRWCSNCHAIATDEGSHNPDAPSFVDVAAEPSTTEYALRVFLRTPHPTMPNFVLKPDDIEDIASYIISLKR